MCICMCMHMYLYMYRLFSFILNTLLNVSQKLFQCSVEKLSSNRYEMRVQIKSNDTFQLLRSRTFHLSGDVYNSQNCLVDEAAVLTNRLTAFGRRLVKFCTMKYSKSSVLYAVNALFLNED